MTTAVEEAPVTVNNVPPVAGADWPYEFEILEIKVLIVDHSYQRPLTSFVNKIAENFDPALLGCLVVSTRKGGKYAVVDGQTRMEGAKKRGGITRLPCIVYKDLTPAQEASLFARLQKERRGVASFHRFRAALVAGEQEAIDVEKIVKDCGYEVGLPSQENPVAISAVAALEKTYRRGPEILERTLLILREGWKDSDGRPTHTPAGDVINGMSVYLLKNPGIDDEKMARRLSVSSPEELKRRASALAEGAGGGGSREKFMAGAIEGLYNRRGN